MNIKKSIQLTTEPLNQLLEKGESIDFRLNQAVWQDLQEGDYVEFWEDVTGWQTEPAPDAKKLLLKYKRYIKRLIFRNYLKLLKLT